MKYWDIGKILPYQRCFNFINGERSIGKTYTTEKFFIKRALTKGEEFVYIVRTQDEKNNGIFASAFEKVLQKEYEGLEIVCTRDAMNLVEEDENGIKTNNVLGHCIALSEAVKVKKRSFPNVKWLMFDEYMLEDKHAKSYVNGWSEPDLFINIYHTIDREEDRVVCFMLGNNTSFYNPYHMHNAFSIPHVDKGAIWYSENVLFQWATSSEELKEDKETCKFLKMISKTDYAKYAKEGDYTGDNLDFISARTTSANFQFIIVVDNFNYGVWSDHNAGFIFIDSKYDPSCKIRYALTLEGHKENTILTRNKQFSLLQYLARSFKVGKVRFVNMEVKIKTEKSISTLL